MPKRKPDGKKSKDDFEVYVAPLTDFIPDSENPNSGTERGTYMNRRSVEKLGAGRSLVVDENGVVVAGNHIQEAFIDSGFEDAIVIESDGTRPIVHKRIGWDIKDPENPAREYSIVDNRTSQVGFNLDLDVLGEHLSGGLDIDDWFVPDEIDQLRPESFLEKFLQKNPLDSELEKSPYMILQFVATKTQRDYIMDTLREIKKAQSVKTSTDCVLFLCQSWKSTNGHI